MPYPNGTKVKYKKVSKQETVLLDAVVTKYLPCNGKYTIHYQTAGADVRATVSEGVVLPQDARLVEKIPKGTFVSAKRGRRGRPKKVTV